ncbi:NADPH-dependent FMN reductase, partial [Francisella tularensis subsp. holarctica]|nr:NADPH-dependent FMN reductase [Francisella tularensis subsp. holarctica]
TSPGPRGANTVLNTAKDTFGLMSKGEVTPFSLPEFNKNFDTNTGITDTLIKNELDKCITNYTNSI